MQYAVAADVFEADTAPQQVPLEVIGADRPGPQSGSLSDQNVPVGGVRPVGATPTAPPSIPTPRNFYVNAGKITGPC